MIGEVFGNYRVTAKLGEGGMGTVYLAEHPNIGRKVAVKMIRPAFSNDAETLRRFVREARSTATLRHPALVDIMDYGVHEKTGSAYIIMEYLEGESLDARLEREGPLSPPRAADIARQIALGMAAAHRAGIIHRDLKPGNVHLIADPDRPGVDVVKVLDFGIAKLANNDTGAGPTTRSDMLLGTPRYMAPEQCRGGGAFDHRVDIYALGCLFYEALTGRPPFAYQWPGELIAAHLSEMPLPVRALVPTIPEALDSVVMRAIAKKPDHRPPSMTHVARELEHFLGIGVSMPPGAAGPSVVPGVAYSVTPSPRVAAPAPPRNAAQGSLPQGASPTTTASVVMRQRAAELAKRGAAAHPNLSPPPQPGHVDPDESLRRRFAPAPLLRPTLIGAAALTAAIGTIVAIARREPPQSAVVLAPSAELAPATPSAERAESVAGPPLAPAAPSSAELSAAAARGAPASTDPTPAPTPPEMPSGTADHIEDTSAESPSIASKGAAARATGAPPAAVESVGSAIRIKVANPRPGLRVTVDGRPTSLPIHLPRDQKTHVIAFAAPNFKPETKTIVANQDQTLTLDYRPKLYVP